MVITYSNYIFCKHNLYLHACIYATGLYIINLPNILCCSIPLTQRSRYDLMCFKSFVYTLCYISLLRVNPSIQAQKNLSYGR